MSANRILLVCSHCRSMEQSLLIAERTDASATFTATNYKRADAWFEKHAKCGNPDDYQLAFHRPQNWDVSPPAQNTVAGGVKLALVNGSHE